MKQIILTLTFLIYAAFSFAQELKVKSFTHDTMNLEARLDGGRTDLNGRQCALVKVMVRDNIVKCRGGNVGEIMTEGVVKKIFVSPTARYLKFDFQYSFPLKVTFSDYGYEKLTEGATYSMTLVDASVLSQQQLQQLMQQMTQRQNVETEKPVYYEIDSTAVDTAYVDSVAVDTLEEQQYTSYNVLPVTVNGVTFNMIKVEGGTFTMGATSEHKSSRIDEKPTHQVTLSSYYIGETEVTQALWKAVMGNNPSKFKGDDLPVETVYWNDCQTFIRKLNSLTSRKFRLPTEAEWEFAARGGNKSRRTQYSGSKKIDDVAWYWKNSGDKYLSGDWNWDKIKTNNSKTHPVKSKKANELGIYDMSGNVWEWCQDWYGSYSRYAQRNPTGPSSGSSRVYRGGAWDEIASCVRSACREKISPDYRYHGLGLRLAISE